MTADVDRRRIEPKHCRDPRVFLATGCGAGFSPKAPGTAGSLVALPIWWFGFAGWSTWEQIALLVFATAAGVWIIDGACRTAGVGDDQRIVLDEWLGLWIALVGCPRQLAPVAAGFVLFRFFDIWKPWPVSWADRSVKGGLGVVLDDVIAGCLAAGVLQLSLWLLRFGGLGRLVL